MPLKVSIIILNWNQPEFTVNCVNSILKQGYQDFEILLVDNNSQDNSVEIFRKNFGRNKKIRIIENSDNLGYAGGNNEGVRHAKGEYVVILNNDTTVEENWLKELVKAIKSDERIGAASSLEERVGLKQIPIDWTREGMTRTLLWHPIRFERKRALENSGILPQLPIKGCSFIYKKDLANPPFDPEYFIYAEDDYLAWILELKDYQNKIAVNSRVKHFYNIVKKSSSKMNKYFVFLGERNRLMNLLIFYELFTLFRIFPLIITNIFFLNLIEPRKAPYRIKAYLWLLSHPWKVLKKRRHVQGQRKISDKDILAKLSCKLRDENVFKKRFLRILLRVLNGFFCLYCSLVRLKTIERD